MIRHHYFHPVAEEHRTRFGLANSARLSRTVSISAATTFCRTFAANYQAGQPFWCRPGRLVRPNSIFHEAIQYHPVSIPIRQFLRAQSSKGRCRQRPITCLARSPARDLNTRWQVVNEPINNIGGGMKPMYGRRYAASAATGQFDCAPVSSGYSTSLSNGHTTNPQRRDTVNRPALQCLGYRPERRRTNRARVRRRVTQTLHELIDFMQPHVPNLLLKGHALTVEDRYRVIGPFGTQAPSRFGYRSQFADGVYHRTILNKFYHPEK